MLLLKWSYIHLSNTFDNKSTGRNGVKLSLFVCSFFQAKVLHLLF